MNKSIFRSKKSLNEELLQRGMREGIEIEKGAILTEQYLIEHEELFRQYADFFTAYPDIFLDLIKPDDSNFTLFFYQRIVLRAIMRFKEVFVTACRAFSKSFLTILALFLQCVFIPGTKRFICAPNKNQSAQIGKEKLAEIYDKFPLLRREVIGGEISDMPGNFGKDYVTLKFRNGSQFDVVGALDSQRGGRRHGGLIDEIRDHDETALNEIVLPLLNVSRRLPDNTVNEKEVNQQVISMTSAGTKTSYAYDRLIDNFENAIIDPSSSFVFGCDYRVPVLHGLLDKSYINKLKMSPSYNEESFARELTDIAHLKFLKLLGSAESHLCYNIIQQNKCERLKNRWIA